MTQNTGMLFLPGDPQAAGEPPAAITPLAASASLAARVLLGSAAFVLGACAARPWTVLEPAAPSPRAQSSEAVEPETAEAPHAPGRAKAPARATPEAPRTAAAPQAPSRPMALPEAPGSEAASGLPTALRMPVEGVRRESVPDTFDDRRGVRRHKALDIMAPRGTRVVAVADGEVARVYRHLLGGLSVYQYDATRRYSFYYAHLEGYAPGLREGMVLRRGDLVGFVGTTGNATPGAPHLHFAMLELGPDRKWWKGTPVNPHPLLE
jgi:peptidoglycan LD-endopeptidase LytH